jgi:hypothetical protein
MAEKENYEVRIRIQIGPDKWVKKSRFYEAKGPKEARECYDGPGQIMSVEKAHREKFLGVGEFFKLGDTFLEELRKDAVKAESSKDRVRQKRYLNTRHKFSEEGL